jgi:hypothetical protein
MSEGERIIASGNIISGSMKPVQSTYVDYYEINSTI